MVKEEWSSHELRYVVSEIINIHFINYTYLLVSFCRTLTRHLLMSQMMRINANSTRLDTVIV